MTNQQRQQDILNQLHASVAKLLKSGLAEVDVDAPFLELGADSLVLVEAINYVERTFGIKIGIRQIFEELTTIALLAKHVHEQIPLEENTAPEPILLAPINRKPATNGNSLKHPESNKSVSVSDIMMLPETLTTNAVSGLERIMQQQLQIVSNTMSEIVAQQLTVLRQYTASGHHKRVKSDSAANDFRGKEDRELHSSIPTVADLS